MRTKPVSGVLDTIGNTPLAELSALMPGFRGRVFGKLEFFNPGGSIKDRSAAGMILEKIKSGELEAGRSVIVESSSGNLAIGLAQICRYFGLRLICVVDAKTTEQNLAILRAYQVGLDVVTDPDPVTGEFLSVRKKRVWEIVEATPHAYSPDQYSNALNPKAHERTMAEIATALDGRVDYLFSATSTTGTLNGCAAYVREHGLDTTLIAVDAVGSLLYGDEAAPRLIPGHGASVAPALLDRSIPDQVVHVSDLDCVVGCRKLVGREAILAGGSSGATVAALARVRRQVPDGATCVLIFPDRGDRYLDTIYSDSWVTTQFGEVAHLWKEDEVEV
ncbi:2,3-diaminopropionate biosynthesis protein SbnA [Actinoallomurus rhizosphaericola]|uniref:2,3-diaminopropionate biosynthesis protein SbnA n=1 Tax=Actinoallomurus rhizosphaericola TaxID=2952536 RepID=UPI002093B63E|nr:2,3-diaminopropionate biosynthesis protein SbnA [Actinoallomurus rhizosphaericola]MCO5995885.1 2,3-diaminopropionate biosynthesis protein SbnA [Actinoallomurus rhizosphaericola]